MGAGRNWLHEVLVAFDQFVNALLAGWSDESISARSYRLGARDDAAGRRGRWWWMWRVVDVLFWPQDFILRVRTGQWPLYGHCQRAYKSEQARLGMPPEYRNTN